MKKIAILAVVSIITLGIGAFFYFAENKKGTEPVIADTSLDRVKRSGDLRIAVAIDLYPWAAYDARTGIESGGEIEIAQLAAKELGIEARFIASNDPMAEVKNGNADVAVSRLKKDLSQQGIAYTRDYFTTGLGLIVRANSPVKKLSDLSGKKVAVTPDLCCPDSKLLVETNNGTSVTYSGKQPAIDGLKDLEQQKVDAAIFEMTASAWYVKNHPLLKFTGGDENNFITSGEAFVGAVKKEDAALLDALNKAIEKIKTNGKYKDIINKWYIFRL